MRSRPPMSRRSTGWASRSKSRSSAVGTNRSSGTRPFKPERIGCENRFGRGDHGPGFSAAHAPTPGFGIVPSRREPLRARKHLERAFAKAARLGADYVEFDVHTARDGQFFLLHDGRLNRTTNGTGPIAEQVAEQLTKLSAGGWFGRPYASQPLPTLDAFLATVAPDVQLIFRRQSHHSRGAFRRGGRVRAGGPDHRLSVGRVFGQTQGHQSAHLALCPRWAGPNKSTAWRKDFSPTPWMPVGTFSRKKSLTTATPGASRSFPMRWEQTRKSSVTGRHWIGALT